MGLNLGVIGMLSFMICNIFENKFWHAHALCYAVILIICSCIGCLCLFLKAITLCFDSHNSLIFWATFLGSCVAIGNACLLYATLNTQKESLRNEKDVHNIERFETTFFNLLASHRKLTDEISITYGYINENADVSFQKIAGREFFRFMCSELKQIPVVLESEVYSRYNKDERDMVIAAFEDDLDRGINQMEEEKQVAWKKIVNRIRIEYYNYVYDISAEDRKIYASDKSLPYILLKKKWYGSYEHYIRNLINVLTFVSDTRFVSENQQKRYIAFVQSQMSKYEIDLIVTHARSSLRYREILEKLI